MVPVSGIPVYSHCIFPQITMVHRVSSNAVTWLLFHWTSVNTSLCPEDDSNRIETSELNETVFIIQKTAEAFSFHQQITVERTNLLLNGEKISSWIKFVFEERKKHKASKTERKYLWSGISYWNRYFTKFSESKFHRSHLVQNHKCSSLKIPQ